MKIFSIIFLLILFTQFSCNNSNSESVTISDYIGNWQNVSNSESLNIYEMGSNIIINVSPDANESKEITGYYNLSEEGYLLRRDGGVMLKYDFETNNISVSYLHFSKMGSNWKKVK